MSYISAYTLGMAELFTPRTAAERLGISYPTIKQWLYRGKLRAVKTPGGHYRIHERDIQSFLRSDAPPAPKTRQLTSSVSGRNQLVGKIVQLRYDGLLAQVKIEVGGQFVTAIITADAARELQLRTGMKAAALIKATEVMVVRV
jgi:molybdopterin-binding protein